MPFHRALRSGELCVCQLTELLEAEPDRYVLGMLAEALAFRSSDARVIRALAGRRWSTV